MADAAFDEEVFNLQLRKFLKKVGVTSQREIESAVRAAAAAGRLRPGQRLPVAMTLSIPELGLEHRIDDDIALG
jgi:hypothetical protein